MTPEMLTEELLYAEDGHASDVVLTSLADGEEGIVPPALKAHVIACPTCHSHLGNAALLSLRADRDVAAHLGKKASKAAAAAPHSPYRALALGLATAFIGALPRLATLPDDLATGTKSVATDAPSLLRLAHHGLLAIGHAGGASRTLVSLTAALVLVAFAAVLARRASRAPTS